MLLLLGAPPGTGSDAMIRAASARERWMERMSSIDAIDAIGSTGEVGSERGEERSICTDGEESG